MKWISFRLVRLIRLAKFGVILIPVGLLTACNPKELQNRHELKADEKVNSNVIYGSDGRLDLYQVTDDRLKRLADSTVALVKNSELATLNGSVTVVGKNFGADFNLCATEKFREQNTAAFCSGSLVGPDIILTAGHCIEVAEDCQNTSFIFGFAVKAAGLLPKSVPAQEVYRCKEIIKTVRTHNGADFALIRIDRAVFNHAILPVRPVGDVNPSASLVVIGHPVGLPTKVTTGGTVRSIASAEHFSANLDTYGGNSGSAVINLETGLIEGVLVRGEQDFQSAGSCNVSKTCAEGSCRGEDVTKISVIRPFISSVQNPPAPPAPPTSQVEIFTASKVISIPDRNTQGISSSVMVTSAPQGRKVLVKLDVIHPYIGDLVIKAIASDGQIATIHHRAGGSADNIRKSYEVTSSFGKVQSTGNYKLVIQDLAAQDIGQLISWSVEFR